MPMSVVLKYQLDITDEQTVEMPKGAELLHVAEQFPGLLLWARVLPSEPREQRVILIRGTGHPIWSQPYVGTVVSAVGALVWHVFDGADSEASPG